jgi:NADH-ubiquinone oxidoreductase chain 3
MSIEFIILVCIVLVVGVLLLGLNYFFSERDTYPDKIGPFECGLSSFSQTRTAFSIVFVLVAILFLPFDLEITSVLPFGLSSYIMSSVGMFTLCTFIVLLTVGFIFEINKDALRIRSHMFNNFDSL